MLRCSLCNEFKSMNAFNKNSAKTNRGYDYYCRVCLKNYRNNNKEHISIKRKIYRESNKEKIAAQKQASYIKHRDKIIAKNVAYEAKRLKFDLQLKIAKNLRSRLRKAIQYNYKTGSAVNDLGCSIEYFINEYMASLFIDGMSWENYGEWHIDHIVPLSLFDLTDREQFLKACHYTNLQPLWAEDNFKKGAK